ncbi:MAG TPA: TIGR03943 family protein [Candidatus Sulfotelmatobacter sp.]|nr:TIGR03943 family protein [Candidatus Sulfotelmatobacter sp.]
MAGGAQSRTPGVRDWLWLFVLTGYAGYFGYLLFSDKLQDLVSPRMTVFVVVGFATLVLFVVVRAAGLARRRPASPLKSGFILFVAPFLFVPFTVNPNSALLSLNRGVLLDQNGPRIDLTTKLQAAVNPFVPEADPKPVPSDGPIALSGSIVLDRKNYYAVYQELYSNPDAFVGRTIRVSGFIYHYGTGTSGRLIVARELMWCCAADAVTIGFITQPTEAALSDAEWVAVSGTLATTTYANPYTHLSTTVPLIKVDRIDPMKGPDFAFVYPS